MKRNMLKKVTAILAMMSLILGCIAPAMAEGLDTSKEVELVMYVISDRPAGQDIVEENLNAMLKEKLNCTLRINWIGWAEFANKYPLLFASGESFDIAYCATWLNYTSLAQRGAFKALDELWPTYAPKNYAATSAAAISQATVDGHIYCVPTQLSTYNTYGAIYRTDILEGTSWEEGKIISSLKDVEEYCAIVKETHPELEPIDIYSAGPEWFCHIFMPQNDRYLLDKNTTFLYFDPAAEHPQVFSDYEYEGTPDFLEMMNSWNEKGYFSKNALADTDSNKTGNGKAALRVHNIDSFQSMYTNRPEWKFEYGVMTKDIAHLPYTQDCMVISNTAQNPERALAFWDLLTNDQDLYDAFFYGILGTSYTLNDAGQYKITDVDLYNTNAMWAARTDGLNRDVDGSPERYALLRSQWEEQIQPGVGNEKYTGFVFDTSAVEVEYGNCLNMRQQYWWPLELGYVEPVSGLEQYKKMMEQAGVEKVKAEMQRQLDEYLANLEK